MKGAFGILEGCIPVPESGCFIWLGAASRGHGMLAGGLYVHRIVYEHFYGPIPRGYDIAHKCDVGLCCRPEHLEAVTRARNVQDAFARNRYQRGRYTTEDVIALRAGRMSEKEFRLKYKLRRKTVYNIYKGHKAKWRI